MEVFMDWLAQNWDMIMTLINTLGLAFLAKRRS